MVNVTKAAKSTHVAVLGWIKGACPSFGNKQFLHASYKRAHHTHVLTLKLRVMGSVLGLFFFKKIKIFVCTHFTRWYFIFIFFVEVERVWRACVQTWLHSVPGLVIWTGTHGVLLICPLKIKKRGKIIHMLVCWWNGSSVCRLKRIFYFYFFKVKNFALSSAVHLAQLNTWNSAWGQTAASNKNQTVVNLGSILETLKGSI